MGKFITDATFSPYQINDFKLSLDWKEVLKNPDDILGMAEKIGEAGKIQLIVCIDDFQNISAFDNPLDFQKKLRAHWQLQ